MEFAEISLLVLAALPVLYRAWSGCRHGATLEVRQLLATLFGMLVAIRYWQPCTETLSGAVTFDPRLVAVLSFLMLFAVGAAVAGYAVDLRAKAYQSVKPNYVNNVLGLLAGLFSGVLIGACILWVASLAKPGLFDSMAAAKGLREFPRQVFQAMESGSGVAADSAARVKYPVVSVAEVSVEGGSAPEGAVLMRQRGTITWQ